MSALKELLCGSGAHIGDTSGRSRGSDQAWRFHSRRSHNHGSSKRNRPGATNVPLLRLKRHLNELPKNKTIVTYCGTGERAGKAKDILEAHGFHAVNGGSYAEVVKILEKK